MLKNLLIRPKKNIKYNGNNWTLDGSTYNLDFASTTFRNLYGPNTIYSNGRTYITTKTNPYTSNQRPGIIQYYNGSISIQFLDRDSDSEDRHDYGILVDDGTGKITYLFGQHNPTRSMGRVEVWRMSTAHDITSFVYKGLSSEFGDYCKPYYRNSDNSIICIGRRDPLASGGDGCLYMSVYDNDTTWTTPVQILDHESSPPVGGEPRYYPSCFQGHDQNSEWAFYFFSRRLGETFYNPPTAIYREKMAFKFRKENPFIIYNLTETFSKDINADGHISWNDIENNFVYATNTTAPGGNKTGIIIGSEIYSAFLLNGIWVSYYFNGVTWQSLGEIDPLNIMDKNNGIDNDTSDIYLSKLSNTIKQSSESIYTPLNGIWATNVPVNYTQIPKGAKFACAIGSLKNNNSSTVNNTNENDIYILEMIK
jgi:hypothetical protein